MLVNFNGLEVGLSEERCDGGSPPIECAETDKQKESPKPETLNEKSATGSDPGHAQTAAYEKGLGCRDSNPNYLIQSQASYR